MSEIPDLPDALAEAQAIVERFYLRPDRKPKGQAAIDDFLRLQELFAAHGLRIEDVADDRGRRSRKVVATG